MKSFFTLIFISLVSFSGFTQNLKELKIGDKMPIFKGLDENGEKWNSKEVKSDFLVIYFYPAAMTSGCTKQACTYRDDMSLITNLGATVVGISGDEVKNLEYFTKTYQLNFTLLSDSKGEIAKSFGVPTSLGGTFSTEINGQNLSFLRGITAPRSTFVVNKKREIIYKNTSVNAADDSKNVQSVISNYIKNKH